jgi:hypothetical protein
MKKIFFTGLFVVLSCFWFSAQLEVSAKPFMVGPDKCQKCHKAEHAVWKGTKHFKSFKKVHKNKKAKKIVKAIGEKRMKKAAVCANCHYTSVKKKATDKKAKLVAGPSCESCHGAASEWIGIHNNTKVDKAKRFADAKAAGMIWPTETFDVASNCMSCHGLANENLSGKHATAMLDNGHPFNPDFEYVEYSQGSVRHRFYAPKMTVNQEMTEKQKAEIYIIGQSAAMLSATQAITKTTHPAYVKGQKKRISNATAALNKIKAIVPEAGAFLSSPSKESGRALAKAVKGKDLTGAIGASLPKSYK